MRTLVTGGAGCIGSALVDRLLAEGCTVDVVDDLTTGSLANLAEARSVVGRRFSFQRLDVANLEIADYIARKKPEVIFHLAAQCSQRIAYAKPAFDAAVNIGGTLNVLEGAVAAGTTKICFTASGTTLYGTSGEVPTREASAWKPVSPFGVSKKSAMDYCHSYRETRGLEYTALALANVYGPRQATGPDPAVIASFAPRFLDRARVTIYGDGNQTRDFVFVDDVVDALWRSSQRAGGLVLNIGTGVETSIQTVHDRLATLTGFHAPARYEAALTHDPNRVCLDPGRAEIHLGWKPFTDLDDGLARTLEYYKVHPAARERATR